MTNEQDYKYDLFISYNTADEEWAQKLATRVEQESCGDRKLVAFFAPWDIRPGESVDERLDRALSESRYLGLILSEEAVQSQWVSEEWYSTHHADMRRKERRIIPLYRRTCDIPHFIAHLNRIDFRDDANFDEGVRLLLAVLRNEPLPRGEREEAPKNVLPSSTIPRPPVIGFVSRRDPQGRDIIARLKEELAPGRDQLVTLSGPGGIGKTTLAAEAARTLQAAFENRVVWSSADGRADFALPSLLDDIATQLGRAELRTLALVEKEEQVRALTASALVVLDNYETIAEAERSRIEAWFKRTQCSALFTSRPGVPDTVFVPVLMMSHDEAAEFLEKLTKQTHDPQFFTPDVRARIHQTAEANPYVMQWVVGQIDLAQEPDAVLEELRHGDGDAARRVFDRSFKLALLGKDGRDTLFALSLFAPSATPEALTAVAGFGDVRRTRRSIKNLKRLWLVNAVDDNRRLAVEGLTRSMAAARLTSDARADSFRHRFITYFRKYAVNHRAPTPANHDALEVEKDNLLRAIDLAAPDKDIGNKYIVELADLLAKSATGMLGVRGYWDEALLLSERAAEAARTIEERDVPMFKMNAAWIRAERGELDDALKTFQEALDSFKASGHVRNVASCLLNLSQVAKNKGDYQQARKFLISGLDIFKKLSDEAGIAHALQVLGTIEQAAGNLAEAQRLYHESMAMSRNLGDSPDIALSLHWLGKIAISQNNLPEARRLYSESLKINEQLGAKNHVAFDMHQLGYLAMEERDLPEAERLLSEALRIWESLKSAQAADAREALKLLRLLRTIKGK